MKKLGIFLCCQSMLTLSLVIGLACVAQCADKVSGSFYTSLYGYISIPQWFGVAIPFIVGIILCIYEKMQSYIPR